MSPAKIHRYFFNGIRVFLKGYSTNADADLTELEAFRTKTTKQ